MSKKHPIISVTGSSGAGTSTVKDTFDQIFRREGVKAVSIEGDPRHYVHNEEEAKKYGVPPGKFTEWKEFDPDSDLLFYEGLHGAVKNDEVDLTKYADLKIGVVPVVNLEWIQKIHRDKAQRGYTTEAVTDVILRRMHAYVHCIMPQFTETDINFQRVPVVPASISATCFR